MSLRKLVAFASDKSNFEAVEDYISFARRYLDFTADVRNIQAEIVSQNERHYFFLQYKKDGHFNITRPLNSKLFLRSDKSRAFETAFMRVFDRAPDIQDTDTRRRNLLRNAIYTIQQSIGATLDALPAGKSNTARKINGDLFERLIRLLVQRLGVACTSGTIRVPVLVDGVEQFKMSYQHDLIIKQGEAIKAIGGVKTSSKDRLDKIFMDKFLYCKLTETDVPHVAIFLNDVQRKNAKQLNRYGVSATFLPGHFKGFTIKLNPLDGVYYCDLRPNMTTDPLLQAHIRTIDHFFCSDLWRFAQKPGDRTAEVLPDGGDIDDS